MNKVWDEIVELAKLLGVEPFQGRGFGQVLVHDGGRSWRVLDVLRMARERLMTKGRP